MDLKQKPTEFLISIINARDFSTLIRHHLANEDELKNEGKRLCSQKYNVPHDHYGISLSFFSTLTDVPSYPIVILWTILGLTTLGTMPLIITIISLVGAALLAGTIFFYASYREHRQEATKYETDFQYAALKLEALEIVIERQQEELSRLESLRFLAAHDTSVVASSDTTVYSHLKQAVKATMLVGASLFSTFYTTNAIVGEFGKHLFSGAMLSPIGLAIAGAISLCVGIYFGYTQFQASQNKERINNTLDALKSSIRDRKQYAYELQNRINQLKTVRGMHEDISQTPVRKSSIRQPIRSSPSPSGHQLRLYSSLSLAQQGRTSTPARESIDVPSAKKLN